MFPLAALAGPCTRAEADRADHFARIGAVEAIAQMGPSQNLRTSILSCDYNTFSNLFRVRVDIRWNGALVRSNTYWSMGELTFNFDGTNRQYAEESASQSLRDYRASMGTAGLVFLLLDSAARSQGRRPAATPPASSSTTPSSQFEVFNNCGMDVRLALRWYSRTASDWRNGIWDVAQGDRGYLTLRQNDTRIVTTSREYLYAVSTRSGRALVTGDNVRRVEGTDYRMRRRTGVTFPITINLCN